MKPTSLFLIWKAEIFCPVKENNHLRGGVVLYAAQANGQVDTERVKKGAFLAETI